MTVLAGPIAGTIAAATPVPGWLALVTLMTLLVLLFEKAVATNVKTPGYNRVVRCLDVGIGPLAIAALAFGVAALARIVDPV